MNKVMRGLLAGAVGGLLGSATKAAAEKLYPPRVKGEPHPPVILAQRMAGGQLTPDEGERAKTFIHYTFGALAGAAYGALAELLPPTASREGLLFGWGLWLGAHELALPATGLSPRVSEISGREHLSEFATHAIYGVTVEAVRQPLARALS